MLVPTKNAGYNDQEANEQEANNGAMQASIMQMQVHMTQMDTRIRNGRLRGPASFIKAAPRFVPGVGAEYPTRSLFPQYLHQFYALRHPKDKRDREMLAYLSTFYYIGREDNDSDDGQLDPERIIERLEDILGLDEERLQPRPAGPLATHRHTASARTPSDGGAPGVSGTTTNPFTETPERAALVRRPRNPDSVIPDSTAGS